MFGDRGYDDAIILKIIFYLWSQTPVLMPNDKKFGAVQLGYIVFNPIDN